MKSKLPDPQAQLAELKRHTTQLISEADLLAKLKRGRPLRVKLGVDPTAAEIHLGVGIVLWKLRQFQELGHQVVLIVGDFTARIGDPSGRNVTRPQLSAEQIAHNMKSYTEQAFKILEPERTEIRYNSEWLAPLRFTELMELTSKYTVARLLERDDFAKRFRAQRPISVLEFLYPLAQAYDSVAVQADVELGGNDQLFNLLAGREIQGRYGQEPQVVLCLPLLEGIDGQRKMSKSYGNAIGITASPGEMYGRLMSIPDSLTEKYVQLLTELDWQALQAQHPKAQKQALAREIVRLYHGKEAARQAEEEFERVFAQGGRPQEVQQVTIPRAALKPEGTIWIVDLLERSGLVASRSEARRLIAQGAVELEGRRVSSSDFDPQISDGLLLRVGKRRFVELQLAAAQSEEQ
ncbi:MAG TPA: tyrosine--tRNA ligase [Candidatus Fraserbacteria bacterium]|nr:tyrosine--tRNA ligase [Candidatus Fraserbacteria bacterium]